VLARDDVGHVMFAYDWRKALGHASVGFRDLCFGITGLAARALLGQTLPALVRRLRWGRRPSAWLLTSRARLQLAGLVAALLPGRPVVPASEPGRQPT
jgi:hypothetical protein